jgi:hypothetical protein
MVPEQIKNELHDAYPHFVDWMLGRPSFRECFVKLPKWFRGPARRHPHVRGWSIFCLIHGGRHTGVILRKAMVQRVSIGADYAVPALQGNAEPTGVALVPVGLLVDVPRLA